MKFLPVAGLLVLLAGCGNSAPQAEVQKSSAPGGFFQVVSQAQKQPTVLVVNKSEATFRLLMNRSDGKVLQLDVGPYSQAQMEVQSGHYEAKVLDVDGRVDSAYGTADIGDYRSYHAEFKIYHDNADHTFHIGDKSQTAPLKAAH